MTIIYIFKLSKASYCHLYVAHVQATESLFLKYLNIYNWDFLPLDKKCIQNFSKNFGGKGLLRDIGFAGNGVDWI